MFSMKSHSQSTDKQVYSCNRNISEELKSKVLATSGSQQQYDSTMQNMSGNAYTLTVKNGVPILVENGKDDHTVEDIDVQNTKGIAEKFIESCSKTKTPANHEKKKNLSR